jgi:hypothetical protein
MDTILEGAHHHSIQQQWCTYVEMMFTTSMAFMLIPYHAKETHTNKMERHEIDDTNHDILE